MKPVRHALVLLLLAVALGCQPGAPHKAPKKESASKPAAVKASPGVIIDKSGAKHPWTHLNFNNSPGNFRFAIVADIYGGERKGVIEDAIAKLNLLQPEFVLCVGDLVAGYTEDAAEIVKQRDEFDGIIAKLQAPFFYVPGNHDITNPLMLEKWQERFGRSYYHFVYRNTLFLCLNTEDPPASHISAEQVRYAAKALAENASVRWTFVVLHKSLWEMKGAQAEWAKIESLLKGRPYTVIAGHMHNYLKSERDGNAYIRLATTGGDSSLAGPRLGEFDEIAWVTMTDKGLRIANLALDGIYGEDVVTEDMKAWIGPLRSGQWAQCRSIVTAAPEFNDCVTTLVLNNPAPVPLRVRGAFRAHEILRPMPRAVDLVLAPATSRTLLVMLHAIVPYHTDALAPLEFEASAVCEPPNHPPLSLRQVRKVRFESVHSCSRAAAPVAIDGRLSEWSGAWTECQEPDDIEGAADEWRGPEDGRFRFQTAYDDNYFYVAVETADDHAVVDAGKKALEQDGVCVLIDARPQAQRAKGRLKWDQRFKDFLVVQLGPGPSPDQPAISEGEKLPPGVKAACVRGAAGMAAEIAIPAAYLNEKQGKPWESLRLNAGMIDVDGPGGAYTVLWWRPGWDRPENYAGSGTFQKR